MFKYYIMYIVYKYTIISVGFSRNTNDKYVRWNAG